MRVKTRRFGLFLLIWCAACAGGEPVHSALRVADCTLGGDAVMRDLLLSSAAGGMHEIVLTRMPQVRASAALAGGEVDLLIEDVPWDGKVQGGYAIIVLLASVHADNPLRALSSVQLRKLFSGEVRSWRDADAKCPPNAVRLFAAAEDHAAESVLRRRILTDVGLSDSVFRVRTPEEVLRMLSVTPDGLALTGLPGESSPLPEDVRLVSVDGVPPTEENLTNGRYPLLLVRRLLPGPGAGPRAKRLLQLLNSARGRDSIRTHGMIPYAEAGEIK